MPMIPELVVAFWACLKIGAPFVPVFSGFGAISLGVRMEDAEVKVLFTADGSLRRGKRIELKGACDEAAGMAPTLKHIIVKKRLGDKISPGLKVGIFGGRILFQSNPKTSRLRSWKLKIIR